MPGIPFATSQLSVFLLGGKPLVTYHRGWVVFVVVRWRNTDHPALLDIVHIVCRGPNPVLIGIDQPGVKAVGLVYCKGAVGKPWVR